MAYPPDFLDEIRTRLAVSGVVGRSVKLQRRGREYVGLSPFSNEKSPSFTVNDQKGFYHCFSTGEHGDVFTFLMKTQNLTFPEAVERLAEEAGLEVPRQSPREAEEAQRRATLVDAVEAACRFFEDRLRSPDGRGALDYLRRRGLADDIIARYRLGYAPSGNALKAAMAKQGIDEALLLEARLLNPGRDGKPPFDFFRDRVMFPICDARGRPVAFGGRVMGEGEPKYLNSPETPLFHKGHLVYGLSQARKVASDREEIIVAEGYMDVIALAQAGFENAVAPLGTALTESQLAILWRLAPEPVLCFDGDKAGRRAAERAAERSLPVLSPGQSLRFALLPAGQDPDDLVRTKGPPAMRAVIDEALPLSEVVWRQLTEGRSLDTPEQRAKLERDAAEIAKTISDPMVSAHYLRLLRDRIFDLFRPKRARTGGKAPTHRPPPVPVRPRSSQDRQTGESPAVLRERILLATLLTHPDLSDHVEERLGAMSFADSRLDLVRQSALLHLSQSPDLEFAQLKDHLVNAGFADDLKSLLSSDVYVHASFARPDASSTDATIGWDHTFALCQRDALEDDVRRAQEAFTSNPTDAAFAVFRSLRTQGYAADESESNEA